MDLTGVTERGSDGVFKPQSENEKHFTQTRK